MEQIPKPQTCQGQTLHIHHQSDRTLIISAVEGSNFLGNKSGNSFKMNFNDVVILQSNYNNWVILSSSEFYSGSTLQKSFHSQSTKGDNFLSENMEYMGIIDANETVIINLQFTPKSNNSTIRFSFDVSWRVIYIGREGNDDYRTDLYISRNLINQEPSRITTLGRKRYKLYENDANKNGRNSSNMLFPISGVYNNTDLDSKSFQVVVFFENANDKIVLDDLWNSTLEEIQN